MDMARAQSGAKGEGWREPDGRGGPVIDAEYAVLPFRPAATVAADRRAAPPLPAGAGVQPVRQGLQSLRPAWPRLPKPFTQAGGVGFWISGVFAAALAFWVAGGHALFLR